MYNARCVLNVNYKIYILTLRVLEHAIGGLKLSMENGLDPYLHVLAIDVLPGLFLFVKNDLIIVLIFFSADSGSAQRYTHSLA